MYKLVLTHEVLPGKLPELKVWFKQQDQQRQAQEPGYTPWKRYITIFGSVHQLVIEVELAQPPQEPWPGSVVMPNSSQTNWLALKVNFSS